MASDQGDVCLADLGNEMRHRVIVLSDPRFERASGRVLVAPAIPVDDHELLDPWRVRLGSEAFALDLMRSLRSDRLLGRVDRAPAAVVEHLRAAIRHIV